MIDWNETLETAAKQLGQQILSAVEGSIDDWEDISEENRMELQGLAILMGQLKIREIMGEDVSDLVKHVDAQISNLKFVNQSIGARVSEAFWMKVLSISGSIIFGIAKKVIGLP